MNKAITFPNSTTLISLYLNQDSMHSYVCRKDVREKNCRVPWYFVFLVPRGAWKHVPHNCSLLEIEKKKKMPNNTYPSQECAALPICNISSEPFADRDKIVLILKQGILKLICPEYAHWRANLIWSNILMIAVFIIWLITLLYYIHTLSNENTPVVAQTHPTFLQIACTSRNCMITFKKD